MKDTIVKVQNSKGYARVEFDEDMGLWACWSHLESDDFDEEELDSFESFRDAVDCAMRLMVD